MLSEWGKEKGVDETIKYPNIIIFPIRDTRPIKQVKKLKKIIIAKRSQGDNKPYVRGRQKENVSTSKPSAMDEQSHHIYTQTQ